MYMYVFNALVHVHCVSMSLLALLQQVLVHNMLSLSVHSLSGMDGPLDNLFSLHCYLDTVLSCLVTFDISRLVTFDLSGLVTFDFIILSL